MFKINYRIVESYKRLKEMDTTAYDREGKYRRSYCTSV